MNKASLKRKRVKCCVLCVWGFVVLCVVGGWIEQQLPTTDAGTEFTYYTTRELGLIMEAVISTQAIVDAANEKEY